MTAATSPSRTVPSFLGSGVVGGRARALAAVPLVVVLAAGAAGCVRFTEPGARPALSASAGAGHAGGPARVGGRAPVGAAVPVRPTAARAQASPQALAASRPSVRPTRGTGHAASAPAAPPPPADPGVPQTPPPPVAPSDPVPPPPPSDTAEPTAGTTPVGDPPPSSGSGVPQGLHRVARHVRHR